MKSDYPKKECYNATLLVNSVPIEYNIDIGSLVLLISNCLLKEIIEVHYDTYPGKMDSSHAA